MELTWGQALAWRLERQLLDPTGDGTSVLDVVTRLGAVPAWPDPTPELALGARRPGSREGEAAAGVVDRTLLKTYAFRGATHLMSPAEGGRWLAIRVGSRMWERSSWVDFYRLGRDDWPDLRAAVREALADAPLTRAELAAALPRRFAHLGEHVVEGNDTLLKPLAWHGDLCFAEGREGQATFTRPDALAGWAGVPELAEAGPLAVEHHLRTYGPLTAEQVHRWLGPGLGGRKKDITGWLAGLGDRVVEVAVDGEQRLAHRDDVDALGAAVPSEAVRLLPPYDQWVLGPGTDDPAVVPPEHRGVVSRGAALVVAGGVVAGTWSLAGDEVRVVPFGAAPDRDRLGDEVERLAGFLGRPLTPA